MTFHHPSTLRLPDGRRVALRPAVQPPDGRRAAIRPAVQPPGSGRFAARPARLPDGRDLAVAPPATSCDETFRALGTDVRLIASGPGAGAAVARARADVLDYHARLTRFDPASELCALNADPRPVVPASALLRSAVRAALQAARSSGGLVDPCLLDALEAAGYTRSFEPGSAPPLELGGPVGAASPDPARRWRAIHVDDEAGTIARPPGLRLDLGGSGKGHVADLVARRFEGLADWVVDCGGDIRVGGSREVEVAHPLRAAPRAPAQPSAAVRACEAERTPGPTPSRPEPAARLQIADGAIATSSIVARAWLGDGGRRIHHLLDPSTGQPVWTGLLSATALAPTTLHAETLAKVALLGGADVARVALARRGGVVVHAGGEVETIGPAR
jgi:thiamine biosynthesis lipoprotein